MKKKKSVKKKRAKATKSKKNKVLRKSAVKTKSRIKKTRRHRNLKKIISKTKRKLKRIRRPATKKKIGRIKSGNVKFDKLIKGGFEPGSTNLIIGGNGSGKTIFAMQFLIEGIKRGENVLYITFEEEKEDFYQNMLKIGWDLAKMEKTGKFTFLEYSPEKIKIMLDEGGGTIEGIVIKKKIKRMVIDNLSSFSMLFKDDSSKRQNVSALFDIIKKWDCTTFLTFQLNSDEDKEEESIVEIQADSLIMLHFDKIKGKRKRTIEVLKMRGTDHSTDTYIFDIGKNGIKLEGKIRKSK